MVYLVDLIEMEDTKITNPGNYYGPEVSPFGVVMDNRDDKTHTPETEQEYRKRKKKKEKQLNPNIGPAIGNDEKVTESKDKIDKLLSDPEIQEFLTNLLKKSLSSQVTAKDNAAYEGYVNSAVSFLLEQDGVGEIAPNEEKELLSFEKESVNRGIEVEMEHTTNRKIAMKIALDHLKENPKYYEKLKAVEGDAPYKDQMF